jgi:hypothetical protein
VRVRRASARVRQQHAPQEEARSARPPADPGSRGSARSVHVVLLSREARAAS